MVPLAALSCGGNPPPPAAPGPTASVAQVESAPMDLSPAPEPATLVLFARIKKPQEVLRTVSGYAKIPMPEGGDAVDMVLGASVGRALDLGQPIDIAAAMSGKHMSRPAYAFSFALR